MHRGAPAGSAFALWTFKAQSIRSSTSFATRRVIRHAAASDFRLARVQLRDHFTAFADELRKSQFTSREP